MTKILSEHVLTLDICKLTCVHNLKKGVIPMVSYKQIFKDIVALIAAVLCAIVLVAGLSQNNETLFAALLAFALMVPVIGSSAVSLKNDLSDQFSA
ncbi:hypothetical protein [Alcanivorax sp. DP30]|uniref:hypothetical protein n=1 Tax=Alcanivorax sp. DP30 TaxID=2606217 RepID=UPI001F364A34|nr:hypothetical protein [Alcanivorax sp. DP30]